MRNRQSNSDLYAELKVLKDGVELDGPAQHDSNVRPTPLEEFVAVQNPIYFNDLDA